MNDGNAKVILAAGGATFAMVTYSLATLFEGEEWCVTTDRVCLERVRAKDMKQCLLAAGALLGAGYLLGGSHEGTWGRGIMYSSVLPLLVAVQAMVK